MPQARLRLTVGLVIAGLIIVGLVLILSNQTTLPTSTATISPADLNNPTPTVARSTPTPTLPVVNPTVSQASNTPPVSTSPTVIVDPIQPEITITNPTPVVTQPPKATASNSTAIKLSAQERTALTKLQQDVATINGSISRLGDLMTDTRPDLSSWYDQLDAEFQSWQTILNYYQNTPMPGRIGSSLMPDWLAALAHLQQAAQLIPQGYHQADGILVSQGDQAVAYARQELTYLGSLINGLKGK